MTDQRKEVINQLHELNILILHTKLKATRAQTALRAASEEYAERRKAIHEFLMLNHTDTEVQE